MTARLPPCYLFPRREEGEVEGNLIYSSIESTKTFSASYGLGISPCSGDVKLSHNSTCFLDPQLMERTYGETSAYQIYNHDEWNQ